MCALQQSFFDLGMLHNWEASASRLHIQFKGAKNLFFRSAHVVLTLTDNYRQFNKTILYTYISSRFIQFFSSHWRLKIFFTSNQFWTSCVCSLAKLFLNRTKKKQETWQNLHRDAKQISPILLSYSQIQITTKITKLSSQDTITTVDAYN